MNDRVAIIEYHEGTEKIVNFKPATDDISILEYVKKTFGPLYKIKHVRICRVEAKYDNQVPIDNWLLTTKRLAT
jgi:hypothetical protein